MQIIYICMEPSLSIALYICIYCGNIRICGSSIFMVYEGSSSPRIYILDKNKFWKSKLSYWHWKQMHPQNYIPMNKA